MKRVECSLSVMIHFVLVNLLIHFVHSGTLNYKLSFNTSNIKRSVNQPFYGFTLDFWNNKDSHGKWNPNAGILTLNLSNPNLIALTKELSPSFLRIGGSPEDSVVYDMNGECNQKYGLPKYDCSQLTNTAYYGCINKSRWTQINQFGLQTGATIIFGLNACYGRQSPAHSMNFSNIISLLNYTNSFTQNSFFGFELGNELAGGLNGQSGVSRVNASIYAADFYELFKIVNGKYKLLGNDAASTGYSNHFMANLSHIVASDGLNVSNVLYRLTYHHYPNCEYPNGTLVFSPDFHCRDDQSVIQYANAFNGVASKYGVPAWMGEGAEHTGGGVANISNTFVDCFYYVYQLGTIISYGINGTLRSDLTGGDYELINHYTFEPNPDYWALYIWKQLIGHNFDIFNIDLNPMTNVRAFGFGLKNGKNQIVLIFINFDMVNTAKIVVEIENGDINSYQSDQYFMEPKGTNLQTQSIAVNDVLMEYKNGQFPILQSVTGNPESIDIPPARIVFVVLSPKT